MFWPFEILKEAMTTAVSLCKGHLMNAYVSAAIFNCSDHQGGYAYGNQRYLRGGISRDLQKLYCHYCLIIRIRRTKMSAEAIEEFSKFYHTNRYAGMRAKLGIFNEGK